MVVIPTKPSPLYNEAKYASDVTLGIPSQCVVARNAGIGFFPKRRDQYCHNVCLKVNAKLGGVNRCRLQYCHNVCLKVNAKLGGVNRCRLQYCHNVYLKVNAKLGGVNR
eukprot:1188938-Prorocentrum_minimum.AAC.3